MPGRIVEGRGAGWYTIPAPASRRETDLRGCGMKMRRAARAAAVVWASAAIGWTAAAIGWTGEGEWASPAPAIEWPREIDAPGGRIVLYQPQPESFKGDRLAARAAVSVTPKGEAEPVFGAIWFDALVSTDRVARTVTIVRMEIPRVRFAGAGPGRERMLADAIKGRLPSTEITFPLDNLLAGLDLAEKEELAVDRISMAPPKVVFSTAPAVLLVIDGKPELRPEGNTRLMRVVNTPFTLLLDPASKSYYLKGPDCWYSAADALGPWSPCPDVPAAVSAAVPPGAADGAESPGAEGKPSAPPQIVVATEPTELIVSDGGPAWAPVEGGRLLYMANTESDVFMEEDPRQYYILLAGRWYRGASLDGPWAHVPPDKLPSSFAAIPHDSPKGRVLVHVAGTVQAKEAVLDAAIPQTTAVKAGPADPAVVYDGEPRFEKIEGTGMAYAVNTPDDVISVGKSYYCCKTGVWYAAKGPAGPWEVCAKVPDEIYTIPPSCPIYNVRYVTVYDATPEEVYVGYLPGYTGSYVVNNTVVYGTGFAYPGWRGAFYYPRPWTWGFHPVYNAWWGTWGWHPGPWGSRGWVNWGNGHAGWWGPGGYHPVTYSAGAGKVTVNGKTYDAAEIANTRNRNIYDRRRGARPSPPSRAGGGAGGGAARAAPHISNDVFADRDGNIYRKTRDGWEKRGADGWTKNFAASGGEAARGAGRRSEGAARPPRTSDSAVRAFPDGGRGFDRAGLESQSYARRRGMERAGDFNRSFSRSNRGDFGRAGTAPGGGVGPRGGRGARGGRR